MEPMLICALGFVVYFSYLTVKDIITDLQQEGFLMKSHSIKCGGGIFGSTLRKLSPTRCSSRTRAVTSVPTFQYFQRHFN